MNDVRCIAIQPCEERLDGLIPVEKCFACDSYIEGHGFAFCNILFGKLKRSTKESVIKDDSNVKDNCPLPFYERMRPHSRDEVPESNEWVVLRLNVLDDGIMLGLGSYVSGNWIDDGGDKIDKQYIKSWTYLEVK